MVQHRLTKIIFPTAYIPYQDPAQRWITAWIASDPYAQSQLDDFVLNTRESTPGFVRAGARNVVRGGWYDEGMSPPSHFENEQGTWQTGRVIGRVSAPSGQTIRLKFNGGYLWVRKIQHDGRNSDLSHGIAVTTIAFQRSLLMSFLGAAHDRYFSKQDHELLIFHSDPISSYWTEPSARPSRPWSSVILPMKEAILKDMQRFLSPKETNWYAARGIPHRRGYLFHGEPGAGKTTLVTALASRLRLDIYVITLSQNGMDDARLGDLFRTCRSGSIILIEDIDRIFGKDESIVINKKETSNGLVNGSGAANGPGGLLTPFSGVNQDEDTDSDIGAMNHTSFLRPDKQPSVVTMSGLLNAIDGVASQEGCLLVASTNHPERLDPALCRAGRFDVRVPFGSSTPDQARALFSHFFPLEDFINRSTAPRDDVSLTLLNGDGENEKRPILYDIKTQDELDELALDFAKAIYPEGEDGGVGGKEGVQVSMASLQGYLLMHKEDPIRAVKLAYKFAEQAADGDLARATSGLTDTL